MNRLVPNRKRSMSRLNVVTMLRWMDEAQAGIKIAGRNINNFRYADDTILMAESEELKILLMKVKRVRKLTQNSTFRKLRSWHPVPLLYGK